MSYCKKINMIIVDKCKAFCDILNDYLLNQNDIVVTGIANDGIEALKLIQEKKPDLVLLSIIMPNIDGLGVLERLKTMKVELMPLIIILSAVSEPSIIQRALDLGVNRYIVKPFDFNLFFKEVRQMFGNNVNEIFKPINIKSNAGCDTKQLIPSLRKLSCISNRYI